jgi:hypothetical protein
MWHPFGQVVFLSAPDVKEVFWRPTPGNEIILAFAGAALPGLGRLEGMQEGHFKDICVWTKKDNGREVQRRRLQGANMGIRGMSTLKDKELTEICCNVAFPKRG